MKLKLLAIPPATLLLAATASPAIAADLNIQVLSAVVKDKTIEGAQIIAQKNGASSNVNNTDSDGKAVLNTDYADSDDSLLIIKKDGYSNLVVKCPCNGMSYAISPVMNNLDGLRIVLNWGLLPVDLDSHLIFQNGHVFFDKKSGKDTNLDVDDINSYGPETITVKKKHFGETYTYAVMNFSERLNESSEMLSQSDAKVFVYVGQTLIKTYYVPKNVAGNYWKVFSIDGAGDFHDIDTIGAARYVDSIDVANNFADELIPGYSQQSTSLKLQTTSASNPRPTDPHISAEARQLNQKGEAAYQQNNLDLAIDLLRQATELAPQYGRAFSNLGLVYLKTNRIAESIWANRQAIALAKGNDAHVVRASSYYNIAKIYENAREYESALVQYQLANEERPLPTYKEAIDRMQQHISNK